MDAEFPCLGFQFLGMCSYNPEQPQNVYFDIGSGVSALGFTLAIQQLLKPIYQFRLGAYGVQFWHLTFAVFIGFIAVIFASILPNLPISRKWFFGYPVFWEFLGGVIIAGAYGFTAYLILKPTRIRNFNLITFVRSAGKLLSEASDDDRIKFSSDLSDNIEDLFKHAYAWHVAEQHAEAMEFDRLRQTGDNLSIQGRAPISPFYLFAHRRSLERASYACSLFRILADTKFCMTLVRDCPWNTAQIVRKIENKKLHVQQAENFVQQLARQAIISDESIMSREIEYDGFGEAPLLSSSLFSSPFILTNYRPISKLVFEKDAATSIGYIARLNAASLIMLDTALKHHGYRGVEYMHDVERAYECVSYQLGRAKKNLSNEYFPDLEWHSGIRDMYKKLIESFKKLGKRELNYLFSTDNKKSYNDLVHIIATIIYDSLCSIANSFDDYNDRFWGHVIDIFMDIYPFHESEIEGMNPLQQQLTLLLLKKLEENMNGWYPSISKVILAAVGPYETKYNFSKRTAYVIFKDAIYKELQNLPSLYAKDPLKIGDYLPKNVSYHHDSNTLTHTYYNGVKITTNLTELFIPEVDLYSEVNWQIQNVTEAQV